MKKLLILFGTDSFEHDISILSCKNIIKNIDNKKYIFDVVGIDKNNCWYLITDYHNFEFDPNKQIYNITDFLKMYDLIFPVIHGKNGEDGRLQGLFDILNKKYIGSNLISNALCMDKSYCKIICDKYNIPQIDYIILKKGEKINKKLNYPVIVKPANGGSSIGISIANNKKQLIQAIKHAFNFDNKIVIEKFIKCREIECAILQNNNKFIIDIGEIIPSNTFYDYEDKYIKNTSTYNLDPNIDKNIKKKIKEYAIKIFNIFDCKDLARIDFLYDTSSNQIYFNEINTMPGFTNISMFPLILSKNKITIKNIIDILVNNNTKRKG